MEFIFRTPQLSLSAAIADRTLTWWQEAGVGFYPVKAGREPYDSAYFEKYAAMAETPMGRAITRTRVEMVARHTESTVCDVGIGCGAFIMARRNAKRSTYGYDINPVAVAWLEERQFFVDPHMVPMPALTLWDVLEHIADFRSLVSQAREFVFVSLPIFSGALDVLRSKHYRKDEHFWYFTPQGLKGIFDALGFDCVEENNHEVALGRESIGSFAFKRRD